jgi:hypothetical protein
VHELFVLFVEVAHLTSGLIHDANPERFFPSDLEDRRLCPERVSPRRNRQPAGSAVCSSVPTVSFMLCTHVG